MNDVKARAVFGPTDKFTTTTIERRNPGPTDVAIEIKYVGICHSDIHTARSEWGEIEYPIVPGHEITGIVSEVGSEVTKYSVGDRVGVGCLVNSCQDCDNCTKGLEQHCLNGSVPTYNGTDRYGNGERTQGGYSSHIVVTENFVLKIPEGISLEQAAPLLCAGITTYSPLRHWGAGPGKKVAIVGLGGLGHMGVKLAHALGAEVTVLSRTLGKKEDGLKLGADHYYATEDEATFENQKGSYDLIINTISAKVNIDQFLSLLAADGALVNVGAPPEPLSIDVFSLIRGRKSFAGSLIGGIQETQEMLDFCAAHEIGAEIEIISADEIDDAYERVLSSDVRYRFVIDAATV
jgi:uncharacterized zinc-type alcohol dehydrogenase-like protein